MSPAPTYSSVLPTSGEVSEEEDGWEGVSCLRERGLFKGRPEELWRTACGFGVGGRLISSDFEDNQEKLKKGRARDWRHVEYRHSGTFESDAHRLVLSHFAVVTLSTKGDSEPAYGQG